MDIYDLTALTLKTNEGRRISFQGFDLDRRHFWIFVLSSFVVIPFVGICYSVLQMGALSLIFAPILYVIPFILVETRTQEGMKLRRYQSIYDNRVSNTGKFMICGQQIFPATHQPRTLRRLSLPVAGSGVTEEATSSEQTMSDIFST